MSENVPANIIAAINQWGQLLAFALFGVGVLILLAHLVRLTSIRDSKTKYDFINKAEINALWYGSLFLIIGAVLLSNALVSEITWIWVFVRAFLSIMLGFIVGVILQNILRFYYPFYVEKRLKKLRYATRVSPKTGKAMKLLTEEEEDVHLDEGMIAEEEAFSVDYDVWIDEETGFTQIEKYNGRLHALRCSNCNYQTLKVVKEEVIKAATPSEEGELTKSFQCGYCGHKERKTFAIAKGKAEVSAQAS